MSQDLFKDPLSLFSVKGKTAIITGATGAFGAVAAKTLAAAGANVVLCASGADALKKVAAACEKLGGKAEVVAKRPSSEANCDAIVQAAVDRFGGVDILVVASGQNKVSKIVDQKAADVVGARAARSSRRLLGLLRVQIRGRRHHQGARLRMGRQRNHRERARPDGVPFAADRMDVRRG
jgi:NAD(P)-dependent dehydrogenase (short-subunit alcohol dehydrogenase family)